MSGAPMKRAMPRPGPFGDAAESSSNACPAGEAPTRINFLLHY
jgi:hypothetical protein